MDAESRLETPWSPSYDPSEFDWGVMLPDKVYWGVILRDKVYWGVIRSSSTLNKPDDKSGDKCDDKSDLKSGDKSDDKADFTSDDKSDDKSNDKADDKSNDKSNDKSDDIHPIRSHNNKGGGLRPPPQKRWGGLRPRHLFCGFLCCYGCE